MEVLASIFGSEDMTRITGTTFVHRKNLFRDGFFRCVGRAEEGMTSMEVMQSSMCGCLDLDMDKVMCFPFFLLLYLQCLGAPAKSLGLCVTLFTVRGKGLTRDFFHVLVCVL